MSMATFYVAHWQKNSQNNKVSTQVLTVIKLVSKKQNHYILSSFGYAYESDPIITSDPRR